MRTSLVITIQSMKSLSQQLRPDIALVDGSKIVILELTVCHESNLEKSKLFKFEKYTKIREHLK